jgi:hypothetical protein
MSFTPIFSVIMMQKHRHDMPALSNPSWGGGYYFFNIYMDKIRVTMNIFITTYLNKLVCEWRNWLIFTKDQAPLHKSCPFYVEPLCDLAALCLSLRRVHKNGIKNSDKHNLYYTGTFHFYSKQTKVAIKITYPTAKNISVIKTINIGTQ